MDIQKGVENSIANAKYPPPLKKKKSWLIQLNLLSHLQR